MAGGLNLPCVATKADSLFLSQTFRLLAKQGNKQYMHLQYWLGRYIRDYFHEMVHGAQAKIILPYFLHLGDVKANEMKKTSAKTLVPKAHE